MTLQTNTIKAKFIIFAGACNMGVVEWPQGKPAVALTPGTVIAIPEGVKHWHGAAADTWMQHLAIHTQEQPGATNEWLEPVSEKQYSFK